MANEKKTYCKTSFIDQMQHYNNSNFEEKKCEHYRMFPN